MRVDRLSAISIIGEHPEQQQQQQPFVCLCLFPECERYIYFQGPRINVMLLK